MKSTELKQKLHDATHKTTVGADGQPKESLRMRLFITVGSLAAVAATIYGISNVDQADKAGIHDSLNVEIGRKVLHADIVNPDQRLDTSFDTDQHKVLIDRIGQESCTATFSVYRGGDHGSVSKKVLDHLAPNRAVITGLGNCDPAALPEKKDHISVPPNAFPLPSANPSFR